MSRAFSAQMLNARQPQLFCGTSVSAMGAGDAIDGLRMRLAAYAVGAHEMLESVRIQAADKLFGMCKRDSDKEFIGGANAFSKTTVLITGANQGIGLATAKALYRRGSKVVLACRSLERGREAAAVRVRISTPSLCRRADPQCSGVVRRRPVLETSLHWRCRPSRAQRRCPAAVPASSSWSSSTWAPWPACASS